MDPSRSGEVDAIWRSVKTWGKFQMFQLFIVIVDFFPACFAILSAVFTGYIPEYECAETTVRANLTDSSYYSNEYEKCDYSVYLHEGNTSTLVETQACHSFKYGQENTYATEWNLVCNRANLAALAQSLVLAGQGIGALTMSHLADRFGRKTVHVLSHIGVLVTMLIMAFSQNITMLLALRLVAGTFQQGMVCTGKILMLEMFPKEVRSHMEAITFLAWTGGIMGLTVFGYAFRDLDWRYLQIGLAVFSVYALFEWWMMEESVRWLLSNGKTKEAERILKKAARWNNVNFADVENVWKENVRLSPEPTEKKNGKANGFKDTNEVVPTPIDGKIKADKVKKYTVIDILKNPALRVNTFILWYAWIVATGTYYGLTLVTSHLAGDRFVNFFLSGVIEIPALLLEFYLFNKIGRKKTLILMYATAGTSLIVSTLLLTVLDHYQSFRTIATVLSLIGKSASTGSFSTVFLYTPEIYPTNYRNSGLGIASSISRIGGILAPFASNLDWGLGGAFALNLFFEALIAMWIPGAIFGGMCLMVTLLALRLPESAKHELPKTIAECNEWEDDSGDSSGSSEMVDMNSEHPMKP